MPEKPMTSEARLRDAAYAEANNFTLPDGWDAKRVAVYPIAIDSATTKDRDDAIAFDSLPGGGYQLHVSIADVGTFLPGLPQVEAYARHRGETEYLRTSNVPMIPPSISEDKLSLAAFELRPALGVTIELDANGDIHDTQLGFQAVSAANMTYDSVAGYLKGDGDSPETSEKMRGLNAMANRLLGLRHEKGAAAFYLPNKGLMTDIDGNVVRIRRGANHSARLIVQEFMIAANYAVAEYDAHQGIPFLYRNHRFKDGATVEDIAAILQQENPDGKALGSIYERARYSPERIGHAALNLDAYAHFTSPLRRGADAFNHANVAAHLRGEEPPYPTNILAGLANHFNTVQYQRKAPLRERQAAVNPERVAAAATAPKVAPAPQPKANKVSAAIQQPSLAKRLVYAIELQQVPPSLQADIANRIDQGELASADMSRLFGIKPGELLPEIEQQLVKWCFEHPHAAVAALSTAFTGMGTIHGLEQQTREVPVGLVSHYNVSISFTTLEGVGITAEATRPSKKQAQQHASVRAISKMYGIELPEEEASDTAPRDNSNPQPASATAVQPGHLNSKTRLQEFTQKRRLNLPEYEDAKTDSGFSSTATIIIKGQFYTATGTASTIKEAQKAAAAQICDQLGIDIVAAPAKAEKSPKPKASNPENNPIGYLGEYCAKRHVGMPHYTAKKEDGISVCTVTLGSGENARLITATGTNAASAKRQAARLAIEQGLDFLAESEE